MKLKPPSDFVGNCLACQDLNTANNITNKFIADCKITDANRVLVNGASASQVPLYSSLVVLLGTIAALGL